MQTGIEAYELFTNMPDNMFNTPAIRRRRKDRKELAGEIFNLFFARILLDIIENNATFVLPLKMGRYGEWHVKSITGEEFKRKYRRGKWNDLDYIQTNFTGNEFRYSYLDLKGHHRYVNGSLAGGPKKRLKELTLQQKQYY